MQFDLVAVPTDGGAPIPMVSQVGMFAYPLASPAQPQQNGEYDYQLAYLQAVFPDQSETSPYHLAVMDRDGSNRKVLFPGENRTGGIAPQTDWGSWSPDALPGSHHYALAVLYQGNLWIVDATTGEAKQVTADGLTTRVLWR